MTRLSRAAQRFLRRYTAGYIDAQASATIAHQMVQDAVRTLGIVTPLTGARAKSPEALRGKLRRKRYTRPERNVTDVIGVRVITYYRDDVDRVAARLLQEFEVNKIKTVDKRRSLGLRAFGYRSVHLIVRLRKTQVLTPAHQFLRDAWFEIQVRSILEHAWAEIEHEVVYKAGIDYPEDTLRRFAALAGTLELLDIEFLSLRKERQTLIDTRRAVLQTGAARRRPFDVASLLAFLEILRPHGRSWRQAAQEGSPFASGLDVSCVEALRAVGLGTPASLQNFMRSRRFRYSIGTFAAAQGISPALVSHLAVVVLAVTVKSPTTVRTHFPEIMYDPTIEEIVRRRAET